MRKYAQELINKKAVNPNKAPELAAIAAGVAPKFAKKVGEDWLENAEVIAYINAEIEKTIERVKITRDFVLEEARKTLNVSVKVPDRIAALRLINDILTQVGKDGGAEDAQPSINIYTDKEINIL
jgi:hypothetical protein